MKALIPILVVGSGGFIGSAMRFLIGLTAEKYLPSLPLGALWVNLPGCFIMGAITALAAGSQIISPSMRLFLVIGFCGGFTTMSSFAYELSRFTKTDNYTYAGGYMFITIFGCMLMFAAGSFCITLFLKP